MENGGDATSATLIYNNNKVVLGEVYNYIARDPVEVEAQVAIYAIKLAQRRNTSRAVIKWDALNVLRSLNGGYSNIKECTGKELICEVKEILKSWLTWKLNFIHKNCNREAHNIARWAKSNFFSGYLSPRLITPAILCDKRGTPFVFNNQFSHDIVSNVLIND